MAGHGMTPEQIAERVATSRAEQGLPRHIEDPVVLARIAGLIKATPPRETVDREQAA